mmetsp:Transcript_37003/g.37655  ORF Transcript_37003/g.37655 Transcript_37003/m.37655 type:complete len:214 (-) Transcript_37003:86-727(-)|eukprot:CAMPEP_0182429654 /NCGR_PEP_ID=MMETSP1167-20130531/32078_1 /TAXON_ID=2988 /ORGANISM="Mallomonas Sp, Strain CCMP3275" /LENGTH=213 /DNA_ID=CAMNT_0024613667 /DNA_START=55 /DNA_END=696 /DNA_ORIENTATION=+
MSLSDKVVKKKLVFKGDASKSKKRKLGKTSMSPSLSQEPGMTCGKEEEEEPSEEIKIEAGIGRITSSGTTVHGHETKFMDQLSPGDAIIIMHPVSMKDETKIVKMVLSNMSIGISSAFSSDLITTTNFKFIQAPKDEEKEREKKEKEAKKSKLSEEEAFGTYASNGGERFTYREKKPGAYGGYKIIQESTGTSLSREQLLDKRSKKKADRFCY